MNGRRALSGRRGCWVGVGRWRTWSSARCCATSARPRRRSGSRPTRPARSRSSAAREPTFTVEEHHYALVRIEGLEPGSFNEYEVRLDGERRWPPADSDLPPSAIRTLGGDKPIDVCFGSCRVALPHEGPTSRPRTGHDDGKEYDALRVLAREMIRSEHDKWPELLFLLGDQVYVDEGSPQTRERIRERRGTDTPPGEEVTDYEEYSWLYEESWSDPMIRWLLSTVSVSMSWDDHDMSDDWNISASWLEEMRQQVLVARARRRRGS